MPTELQITKIMMCMEDAHHTRKSNDVAFHLSRVWREQKEELEKEKGMEDVEDKFIESLIYLPQDGAFIHVLVK